MPFCPSMSKKTIFVLALLLLFSLTYASHMVPAHPSDFPHKTQQPVIDEGNVQENEGCEGIGEDECLMRRTLAAHIDYIYTQKNSP